jgi:hypothetical protein
MYIFLRTQADIAKIRNRERMRKREQAKAERRMKRNEVIELNNLQDDHKEKENLNENSPNSEVNINS